MGIKCLQSVTDLPQAPDAAYVAVNAESAITTVAQLNEMGAGGALLYASGFCQVYEFTHILMTSLIYSSLRLYWMTSGVCFFQVGYGKPCIIFESVQGLMSEQFRASPPNIESR